MGVTHLQLEALLTADRGSTDRGNFALVALFGVPGLRIFEATGAGVTGLGEQHGHRVLRVRGQGTKAVLIPRPPAGRAIGRSAGTRTGGPILLNTPRSPDEPARRHRPPAVSGRRCGCADRPGAPPMPRHAFATTMLDAGGDLRDVQIAARHADTRTTMRYDRARNNLDRHPSYIPAAYRASGT